MRLVSLELNGFKTFPYKTKLEFQDGITTIVGPNGSGKSNISDAIKWILGEQSTKSLRCFKMDDLIFNGNKDKKPSNYAEVSIVIDNSDKKINNELDSISITRKIFRTGESEYLINNKEVRLKDITELLFDTGLGKDGYCIIGQGKIDRILYAKSNEIREIFEEAAGISRYRNKEYEARKKLLQSEENLTRISDIFKELEERIVPLKKQSEKAESYLKYSNIKKDLEIYIMNNKADIIEEDIKNNKIKLDYLIKEKKELENNINNISNKIDEIIIDTNLNSTKIDDLKKLNIENNEKINLLKNQIIVIENDEKNNKKNTESIDSEIKALISENNDIDNKIDSKNLSINDKNNSLQQIEKDLKLKSKELELLEKDKNNYYRDEKEILEKFDKVSQEIIQDEFNIKIILEEIKNNQINLSNASQQLYQFKDYLENYNNDIIKNQDKLKYIKEEINKYNEDIKIKNNKLIEKQEICFNLKEKLQNINLELNSYVKELELLNKLEQKMDGFSNSIKEILNNYVDKNNNKGICSTVCNVIKVSEQYSMAIDVALGLASQNLITQTVNDAQNAINFLKVRKLGRATFLPLETVRGTRLDCNKFKKFEGFVGIASQLCEFEEIYKNIIDYLLGKIIIVDKLHNALKLSHEFNNKFKIVTLDGQVINPGGALTGGSVSKKLGLLNRKSEIKNISNLIIICNKKILEIKGNYNNNYELLSCIEEDIKKNQDILKVKNKEYIELNYVINNLKNQKQIINEKIDAKENTIKDLNNKIDIANLKLSKIKENYNFKVNIKNNLNDEKSKVNFNNINFLNKKEDLNNNINNKNISKSFIIKEIEFLQKELENFKNLKDNNDLKIKNLSNKLDELKHFNKEFINKKQQINLEIDIFNDKYQKVQNEILKINNYKIEIEKLNLDLRKQEKTYIQKSENIIKEISILEYNNKNLERQYDNIINNLWANYNITKSEAKNLCKINRNIDEISKELSKINLIIKKLGNVNIDSIEEYKLLEKRYNFLVKQINDIKTSKNSLNNLINNLNKEMQTMFLSKFNDINKNFSEIFKELFNGGNSNLILDNPNDVLNCDIKILLKLPGKSIVNLDALSGGEKALVAISLYFAIIKVNPVPFCVLDEIEAALDDVNVDRFSNYLSKIKSKTQFIVISHRRGTMEKSDVMYGVTMQEDGISKILNLELSKFK